MWGRCETRQRGKVSPHWGPTGGWVLCMCDVLQSSRWLPEGRWAVAQSTGEEPEVVGSRLWVQTLQITQFCCSSGLIDFFIPAFLYCISICCADIWTEGFDFFVWASLFASSSLGSSTWLGLSCSARTHIRGQPGCRLREPGQHQKVKVQELFAGAWQGKGEVEGRLFDPTLSNITLHFSWSLLTWLRDL